MNFSTSVSNSNPVINSNFTVTTSVSANAYVASATHIEISNLPNGVTFDEVSISREDGINMVFTNDEFSLGNIIQGDTRSANWTFRATSSGSKNIQFRIWSENGGILTRTVTINPT